MKVAFISGTSILKSDLFADWEWETTRTSYGDVSLKRRGELALLNRHGRKGLTPPHAINHRANLQAIADLGFNTVVSVNSVGSLREELSPGTLISCSDYVSFHPATFSDEVGNYEAPLVANNLVSRIVEDYPEPIATGKIYVQMVGPRFETPAEVRIIQPWGDVVGMNMASEADLAREVGLHYNSFCMVDNYANGICREAISLALFKKRVTENQEKVDRFFKFLLQWVEKESRGG